MTAPAETPPPERPARLFGLLTARDLLSLTVIVVCVGEVIALLGRFPQ